MKFALICLAVVIAASGCTHMQEMQNNSVLQARAALAWKAAADVPRHGFHARHFSRGWKRGYFDVSRGSDGRPPLIPPKAYWSFKYQNPAGEEVVQTWYAGYQQGAATAMAAGVRERNFVPNGVDAGYVPPIAVDASAHEVDQEPIYQEQIAPPPPDGPIAQAAKPHSLPDPPVQSRATTVGVATSQVRAAVAGSVDVSPPQTADAIQHGLKPMLHAAAAPDTWVAPTSFQDTEPADEPIPAAIGPARADEVRPLAHRRMTQRIADCSGEAAPNALREPARLMSAIEPHPLRPIQSITPDVQLAGQLEFEIRRLPPIE